MESKVNYTAVGAFVIVLMTAIVVAIIWLSAGINSEDQYAPYKVYMNESVNGLSVGAPVRYNGVEVGTVKTIELNAINPQQVELLLNIKIGTPITIDTTATLDSQGITGISYIALKSRGNSTQLLRALPGQAYPVIKTAPSLLVRLDTALTSLTANLNQVTSKLSTTLDAENQHALKQTLKNLDQLTGSLTITSERLPALVQTTQAAMQALHKQTLPAADQAMNNLNGVTNNLLSISTEVKDNPSVLIRGKTPQQLGPGEK